MHDGAFCAMFSTARGLSVAESTPPETPPFPFIVPDIVPGDTAMSDAGLIYKACLRVERRLEGRVAELDKADSTAAALHVKALQGVVQMLREEIGNALSRDIRPL